MVPCSNGNWAILFQFIMEQMWALECHSSMFTKWDLRLLGDDVHAAGEGRDASATIQLQSEVC